MNTDGTQIFINGDPQYDSAVLTDDPIFTTITATAGSDLTIIGRATNDIVIKTGATDDASQFIVKDSSSNARMVVDGSDNALIYPRVHVKELNLKGSLLGYTGSEATRIVFRTDEPGIYTEGGAEIKRNAGENNSFRLLQRGTGNVYWEKPEGGGDWIWNQTQKSTGFIVRTLGNANTINVNGATDRVGIKRTPTTYDFEVNDSIYFKNVYTSANDLVINVSSIFDCVVKLGDDAGSSNFRVNDSNDANIFSVNSAGNTVAYVNLLVQGLNCYIGVTDTGNRQSNFRMYSDNTYNPSFDIINYAGANGALLIDFRGTGDCQWRRLEGGRYIFNSGGHANADFIVRSDTLDCLTVDSGVENVTINGAAVSAHYDLGLIGDGVLMLKETSTPTADTNYGKVYTKNDDKLYFQDGAGVEHEIAFV